MIETTDCFKYLLLLFLEMNEKEAYGALANFNPK